MQCQSLFSWKNKKNITNKSPPEYALTLVKVNTLLSSKPLFTKEQVIPK